MSVQYSIVALCVEMCASKDIKVDKASWIQSARPSEPLFTWPRSLSLVVAGPVLSESIQPDGTLTRIYTNLGPLPEASNQAAPPSPHSYRGPFSPSSWLDV